MPLALSYEDEGTGAVITASGVVSGEELRGAIGEMNADDERLAAQRFQLWDFTDVERFDVGPMDVWDFATGDESFPTSKGTIAIAVVAPSDLSFGLLTVWAGLVDSTKRRTKIHRTRDQAMGWLASVAPVDHGHDAQGREAP